MRIYASQFSRNALGQTHYPAYLLFGKEPAHIQLNAEALIQHLTQQGFVREFVMVDNASQFDWAGLNAAIASPSLFEPQRLFDIFVPQFKTNKAMTQQFSKLAETDAPGTCWMLRTFEMTSSMQKTAWWREIERRGLVVQHPQLNATMFLNWLTEYAKRLALNLTRDALTFLRDHYQGNLIRAKQALDLLPLVFEKTQITAEMLSTQFKNERLFSVFELCDDALQGRVEPVVQGFNALNESPASLPLLVWSLSKTLNELQTLATNPHEFEQLGIWANRKAFYHQAKMRLPLPHLKQLIQLLFKADHALKTGENAQASQIILYVLLHLSGKQFIDFKCFF